MAIETLAYEVVARYDEFELRQYAAHLLAEVQVQGSFDAAGNRAFGALFAFISGRNRARRSLAMTTPVVQQAMASEKIAMTTPVMQQPNGDNIYTVGFVMPAVYSDDTVPQPTDPAVRVRAVPAKLMAARAYTGTWSQRNYQQQEARLLRALTAAGLAAVGVPLYARYNGPFTLPFLRHNEVLIEVTKPEPRSYGAAAAGS